MTYQYFPNKKYNIILSDPAWTYDDKAQSGNRGAEFKYRTMSLDDIRYLPVNNIAAKDSFLFLWVTFPLLKEGREVLESWGFEYKTVAFTWLKETENGKVFVGMGNYTRANPEICLLGKKGKPQVVDHSVQNYVRSKIRSHSQKPDIIRDKIVKLCGDLPRIELFARTNCIGWDSWGNDDKLNNKPLEDFY